MARAEEEGVHGKALTPFLLGCLSEHTGGASLEANLALLESNALLAAELAEELAGETAAFVTNDPNHRTPDGS